MLTKVIRIAVLVAAAIPSAAYAQQTPFGGPAVADDTLQAVAGREDTTQVAQSQQAATVTRNSVGDNVRTGDAKIEGQAFQNLSGLDILNVNTGNNVAINAAMNVTVAIANP